MALSAAELEAGRDAARPLPTTSPDASGSAETPLWLKVAAPVLVGALVLALWEILVRVYAVPHYVLPGPLAIAASLVENWSSLFGSLGVTLKITFLALAAAVLGGGALAVLFAASRLTELSLYPFAVVLQVTPVVAIAPLIVILVKDATLACLICAWIVAFFPILSNTTLGLNSADHKLLDLFQLYGASKGQVLRHLRAPTALPYFLGGLRISGGLALIGAVVAEFVAGSAGSETGLAYRILEAGYRLQIPKMFAALVLLALTGVAIFALLSLLSHLCLRHWHESALARER
jgi:NitT/TauT family transport system permease protein